MIFKVVKGHIQLDENTEHYKLNNFQLLMYNEQFTIYNEQCTMSNVQWAIYNGQLNENW